MQRYIYWLDTLLRSKLQAKASHLRLRIVFEVREKRKGGKKIIPNYIYIIRNPQACVPSAEHRGVSFIGVQNRRERGGGGD